MFNWIKHWIDRLPGYWYRAIVWLAYNLLGLIFSLGFGGLIVAAVKGIELGDVTNGGQFALYSASLLIGTQYLITRPANFRVPLTEWFGWMTLLGLGFAVVFFTLGTLFTKGVEIDNAFFQVPSIFLFLSPLLWLLWQ